MIYDKWYIEMDNGSTVVVDDIRDEFCMRQQVLCETGECPTLRINYSNMVSINR